MQAVREKQSSLLQLINSTNTVNDRQQSLLGSDEYYRKVENYAEQIRKTSDANEIIKILDIVLSEIKDLQFSDEVYAAQEQVKRAEQKIESLKSELEQPGELD